MGPERVRSEFREVWIEWNSNIVFRVYFSLSRYEAFVSTEDAASGIFLPDMQKGLERERGI